MLFTKTCEYGLQAMIYIATEDRKMGITEISDKQGLPSHYLSKILQNLVKAKLLDSAKGPNGGFWLAKPANLIRLSHIIDAIDGMDTLEKCGLGLKACDSKNPCAIHDQIKPLRENIIQVMFNNTLEDITESYKAGDIVIKV